MITHDEYLLAKQIVEEYEREEFEKGMREAEDELDFDSPKYCDACGLDIDEHAAGCPEDDSPYALLCRRGYD
ncbi:MAG: hypothetical protein QOA70_06885 [Nitrososphaeraceae archaeon]|nr:hypothetical protein [Nitrososphaeraceae archaeon]